MNWTKNITYPYAPRPTHKSTPEPFPTRRAMTHAINRVVSTLRVRPTAINRVVSALRARPPETTRVVSTLRVRPCASNWKNNTFFSHYNLDNQFIFPNFTKYSPLYPRFLTMNHPLPTTPYFDPQMPISFWRDKLPHWEQAGKISFLTFRLGDSMPQSVMKQYQTFFCHTNQPAFRAKRTIVAR